MNFRNVLNELEKGGFIAKLNDYGEYEPLDVETNKEEGNVEIIYKYPSCAWFEITAKSVLDKKVSFAYDPDNESGATVIEGEIVKIEHEGSYWTSFVFDNGKTVTLKTLIPGTAAESKLFNRPEYWRVSDSKEVTQYLRKGWKLWGSPVCMTYYNAYGEKEYKMVQALVRNYKED